MNKLHILLVLEDGSLQDAHGVKSRLLKLLGLECKIDSLRKGLLRLYKQGLLRRQKMKLGRRSFHYWISEKGRQRLMILEARRKKTREVAFDSLKTYEERCLIDRCIEFMIEQIISRWFAAKKPYTTDIDRIILFPLLKERSDERDFLFNLLKQERNEKERYKRLYEEKNAECHKLRQHLVVEENVHPSFMNRFKLAHSTVKMEVITDQRLSTGKIISPMLKERLARKQKEREHSHAILLRRYVNGRWWDLLPPGYNSRLPPVRGPARGR